MHLPGYSYKTNQYGLAVDNVVAIEVVLPTGKVKTVTHASDEDLFFALRGGGNNFVRFQTTDTIKFLTLIYIYRES